MRLLGTEPSQTMIACAADGAGSAKHSDVGSALACETIIQQASNFLESHRSVLEVQLADVVSWCETVRERLRSAADSRDTTLRELATTLCTAILSPEGSIFFQIGDGAITVGNDGVYGVVFWPQSGEYANMTNFMTSDTFQNYLEFQATKRRFTDVALFTDGIERLALDFERQTPHLPFFQPLFRAVRRSENGAQLGNDLAQFLQSDSVKNRSDDDKTLILATRTHNPDREGQNDAAD